MEQTRVRRTSGARPTDDHLLASACVVFAARGFHAATMSEVADGADSTKPTLYAHFGSKDDLYLRVLQGEASRCRTHLFDAYEAAAGLPLRDQVAADVRALFDYVRAEPAGFELLFGLRNAGTAATVRGALLDDVSEHLAQRLADFREPSGSARPSWSERQLAPMLVSSSITAAQHALTRGENLDRACVLATAYMIAGLEALSSRP